MTGWENESQSYSALTSARIELQRPRPTSKSSRLPDQLWALTLGVRILLSSFLLLLAQFFHLARIPFLPMSYSSGQRWADPPRRRFLLGDLETRHALVVETGDDVVGAMTGSLSGLTIWLHLMGSLVWGVITPCLRTHAREGVGPLSPAPCWSPWACQTSHLFVLPPPSRQGGGGWGGV